MDIFDIGWVPYHNVEFHFIRLNEVEEVPDSTRPVANQLRQAQAGLTP
jgi:hypothetical protein